MTAPRIPARADVHTTGWRDVTSLITVPVTSGRLLIQRAGPFLMIHLDNLAVTSVGTTEWCQLPKGFEFDGPTNGVATLAQSGKPTVVEVLSRFGGHTALRTQSGALPPTKAFIALPAIPEEPPTLPGTAVSL